MSSDRIALAVLGALALSGCASTYSPSVGYIDPADMGEANRQRPNQGVHRVSQRQAARRPEPSQ